MIIRIGCNRYTLMMFGIMLMVIGSIINNSAVMFFGVGFWVGESVIPYKARKVKQ
jgi:hypothetical protein